MSGAHPGAAGALSPRGLIVFVHGYLDGPEVWERLKGQFVQSPWRLEAVALQAANRPRTTSAELLEHYARQVLDRVAAASPHDRCPVVVVGHSMGGQVAELVAHELGERLAAMVLVVPAPLAGHPLPSAVMDRFMSRAGVTDVAQIQEGKRSLAVALDDEALGILTRATVATGRDIALEQLRAWTGGHPAGKQPSSVAAPVLLVTTDDKFFTHDMLAQGAARFRATSVHRVAQAGHWPQLERPDALGRAIRAFVDALPD